jgi:hypothetical protein
MLPHAEVFTEFIDGVLDSLAVALELTKHCTCLRFCLANNTSGVLLSIAN